MASLHDDVVPRHLWWGAAHKLGTQQIPRHDDGWMEKNGDYRRYRPSAQYDAGRPAVFAYADCPKLVASDSDDDDCGSGDGVVNGTGNNCS